MSETRGYQTINDRTDFWGPGVDEDDQPTADATPETDDDRWARLRVARQVRKAAVQSQIYDRSEGYGHTDASAAAQPDDNTTTDIDTASDVVAVTGSNTALGSSHSEVSVANRTAESRTLADLDDSSSPKIAAARANGIIDRTEGWGHTSGSLTNRND